MTDKLLLRLSPPETPAKNISTENTVAQTANAPHVPSVPNSGGHELEGPNLQEPNLEEISPGTANPASPLLRHMGSWSDEPRDEESFTG